MLFKSIMHREYRIVSSKKDISLHTVSIFLFYYLYPDTAPFSGEDDPEGIVEHDFKKQTPEEYVKARQLSAF